MWTYQELTILRQMWTSGVRTSEIADAVGHNRSSVIGKAHRLGLPPHPLRKRSVTHETPRPQRRARRVSAFLFVPVSTQPPAQPVIEQRVEPCATPTRTLLSIKECECHWPIGEVGEEGFGFCGAQTGDERQSYCPAHRKFATTASKPWFERRAWFR